MAGGCKLQHEDRLRGHRDVFDLAVALGAVRNAVRDRVGVQRLRQPERCVRRFDALLRLARNGMRDLSMQRFHVRVSGEHVQSHAGMSVCVGPCCGATVWDDQGRVRGLLASRTELRILGTDLPLRCQVLLQRLRIQHDALNVELHAHRMR